MNRAGAPPPSRRPSGRRTRRFRRRVIRCQLLAAAALALFACGGGAPEPVAIVLNEDACSHCRMAISQREYAAELVTPQGRVERFDDAGCLAAWLREHGRPEGAAAFVVDYASGEWLAAEAATYVVSPALPTPMRSGLAAFADPAAAGAASAELGGETAGWKAVRSGAAGSVETGAGP